MFRGFGALTGAITVGLLTAVFFDLFYLLEGTKAAWAKPQYLAPVLGAAWFGATRRADRLLLHVLRA